MVIKTQDENLKKENYVETIINLLTVPLNLVILVEISLNIVVYINIKH